MKKIPFKKFVENKGQTETGRLLGLTQGGVRKALFSDREIYVTEYEDGTFSAEEVKPFPSQAANG